MIIELDHQIIPELPYTWRMALTQGNTGVIASPSESQSNNIVQLANDLVSLIRLIGPCTVNSWLRTEIHNRQVGGASHSAHLLGAAVDLHPLENTVADCKALIKTMSNRVLFMELNTSTWVHVDFLHNRDFIA
jgi:hypothetical protein